MLTRLTGLELGLTPNPYVTLTLTLTLSLTLNLKLTSALTPTLTLTLTSVSGRADARVHRLRAAERWRDTSHE